MRCAIVVQILRSLATYSLGENRVQAWRLCREISMYRYDVYIECGAFLHISAKKCNVQTWEDHQGDSDTAQGVANISWNERRPVIIRNFPDPQSADLFRIASS